MTAPQPWPPTRLCPATSNLPTRMLASTWRTLCAAMQRREAVGANRGKGGMAPEDFAAISAARFHCATCAGRTLPPGLELITQEEATEMARTTKRGTCELCGASANVGMNHGSKVCPQCTHVQSALNKRIESVAAAARSMGKTEDLLGHLIQAGSGIAVKVTADLLQEISGIVGYEGEDPGELVEAVRKRVLTCASCEAEDVLAEIREIVEYSPDMGDSGLADAVRAFGDRRPADVQDCADCDAANALLEIAELVGKRGASSGLVVEAVRESAERAATMSATGDFLRGDLIRACGLEDDGGRRDWGWAVVAAIQTIAEADKSIGILVRATDENQESIKRLLAENDEMRGHIAALRSTSIIGESQVAKLRAELYLAEQSRDKWEQRAVQAEANVETLEAELRNREDAPTAPSLGYCCSDSGLLDIALAVLREEPVTTGDLATLIDAARRAA